MQAKAHAALHTSFRPALQLLEQNISKSLSWQSSKVHNKAEQKVIVTKEAEWWHIMNNSFHRGGTLLSSKTQSNVDEGISSGNCK